MKEKDCALCGDPLKFSEFNLKTTDTKYSHTPLISLVENSVSTPLPIGFNFNICLQCYDLINELDGIVLRQQEIRQLFKKYVKDRNQHNTISDDKLNENVVNSLHTIEPQLTDDISNSSSNLNIDDNNRSVTYTDNFKAELQPDIRNGNFLLESASANFENVQLNGFNKNEQLPTVKEKCDKPTVKCKRSKKDSESKTFICHCSKEFSTQGALNTHMKSHSNYRPFVCEICGQSYKHKAAFNIHIDMHNGINPFTCVYCNKSFTQKGALVRHVPIHTGEMPYQCDECGKRFVHHTSFNVHRLSHTGEKSYKCKICGLALISGSHLKRHLRIHTGEKNFSCGTCGKRFAERYNLVVHEKLHANPASILSKKKFSCNICGTEFKRKVKLDEHKSKKHLTMKVELNLKEESAERLQEKSYNQPILGI